MGKLVIVLRPILLVGLFIMIILTGLLFLGLIVIMTAATASPAIFFVLGIHYHWAYFIGAGVSLAVLAGYALWMQDQELKEMREKSRNEL